MLLEYIAMLGKLVVIVAVGCMIASAIIMTAQNGYRAWKETRE